MTSLKKVLLFGFLVWLIPFFAGFLLFPVHESNRIFFESIMPVVVVLATVIFSNLYLRHVQTNVVQEATWLGIIWLLMSLVIDLILFLSPTPMQMPFFKYLTDIGFIYLIIPVITIGFGHLIAKRK